MQGLVKRRGAVAKNMLKASQVLADYQYWLIRKYGKSGTYLVNAKTFLKTYRPGGTISSQLDCYAAPRSLTIQSFLRRFKRFLEEKAIDFVINDLHQRKLPIGNVYVKLFLLQHQDRLRGELSSSTYATVLNQYFNGINQNLSQFNKGTAERFILAPSLSDYTKRLYKSVLRTFCQWALLYKEIPDNDLNKDELKVKKGLRMISTQSLREIAAIRLRSSRYQLKSYHKESLTEKERIKLLKMCKSQRDRAIVSLMAWNGLRTIEIIRLSVADVMLKRNKVAVWSKGKSATSRDVIKLFSTPKKEVGKFVRQTAHRKGKLFTGLSKSDVDSIVKGLFTELKLYQKSKKYSPHSLRHTAGQLMYDKGVRLEYIQKTLRHSVLDTTMVYAQKAIDRSYFRLMPNNI